MHQVLRAAARVPDADVDVFFTDEGYDVRARRCGRIHMESVDTRRDSEDPLAEAAAQRRENLPRNSAAPQLP